MLLRRVTKHVKEQNWFEGGYNRKMKDASANAQPEIDEEPDA